MFFDTEFIDNGKTIEPISIGILCEDGRQYYAEFSDTDLLKANPWVKKNVIPYLDFKCLRTKEDVRRELLKFCYEYNENIEFWGYYCAYDWVLLCQIFGTMIDLPDGFPMFPYDLRAILNQRGLSEVSQPDFHIHHALSDARWIFETWDKYIKNTADGI